MQVKINNLSLALFGFGLLLYVSGIFIKMQHWRYADFFLIPAFFIIGLSAMVFLVNRFWMKTKS